MDLGSVFYLCWFGSLRWWTVPLRNWCHLGWRHWRPGSPLSGRPAPPNATPPCLQRTRSLRQDSMHIPAHTLDDQDTRNVTDRQNNTDLKQRVISNTRKSFSEMWLVTAERAYFGGIPDWWRRGFSPRTAWHTAARSPRRRPLRTQILLSHHKPAPKHAWAFIQNSMPLVSPVKQSSVVYRGMIRAL